MRAPSLKKYFTGFENVIRSLLTIMLFLFFATFLLFEEKEKLNYLMYVPAACIVILCFIYYIKKKTIPNIKPLICVYVFVGIAYLTAFVANPLAALTYKTLLVLAVFATAVYLSCCIIGNAQTALYALLLASAIFVIAFISVYAKDIIRFNLSHRLGSYFGNENSVAMKLSICAALLASVAVYKRKCWLLPFSLLVFALILTTGSKKGLIYLAVISIFTICSLFRKKVWAGFLISGLATISMVLIITVIPQFATIKERLFEYLAYLLGQKDASASSFQRGLYRDNAFYLAFKKLFLGYGIDGFNVASGIGTYSHNNISELICNFGLFGLLSFYGIFVYIALTFGSVQKKIDSTIGFYVLLGIILLTSTSQIFYYGKLTFCLFALCIFTNNQRNVAYTKIKI